MTDTLQQEAELALAQLTTISQRAAQLLGDPDLTTEDQTAVTLLKTQVDQAKAVARAAVLRRVIVGLTARIGALQAERSATMAELQALIP